MFSGAQKSNPNNSEKKKQNTASKNISSSDESEIEPCINLLFDNKSIDDENDDLERQVVDVQQLSNWMKMIIFL